MTVAVEELLAQLEPMHLALLDALEHDCRDPTEAEQRLMYAYHLAFTLSAHRPGSDSADDCEECHALGELCGSGRFLAVHAERVAAHLIQPEDPAARAARISAAVRAELDRLEQRRARVHEHHTTL